MGGESGRYDARLRTSENHELLSLLTLFFFFVVVVIIQLSIHQHVRFLLQGAYILQQSCYQLRIMSNLPPITQGPPIRQASEETTTKSSPPPPVDEAGASSPSLSQKTEQLNINTATEPSTPVPNANNSESPVVPKGSTHLLEDNKLNELMKSDAGPTALLARLKQSIISAREVAAFVRKKAQFESEHQMALKKLARHTCESIRKPEGRQGSFLRQFESMVKMNERMADVGNTYVAALHTMHDELSELAKSVEKSRKNIKESCLRNEKNTSEAEQLAEKAKAKYDSLCEDFERMRTGDPKSKFGFKQSKTAQHEEELHKKVTAAEAEYRQRVDSAKKLRNELINKLRPVSVKELKELVLECDSGISLQLQKYANLSETLTLNAGFIVSPLKPTGGSMAGPPSMKELASKVDNEKDFYESIFEGVKQGNQPLNRQQVEFRQHPAFTAAYPLSATAPSSSPTSGGTKALPAPQSSSTNSPKPNVSSAGNSPQPGAAVAASPREGQSSSSPPPPPPPQQQKISASSLPSIPPSTNEQQQPSYPPGTITSMPSYGTPLDELLDYEEGTVPRIVYQCIRAIDNFGLEVEGIYRTNGNQLQVQEIKKMFDADSSAVDLLHPNANVNDIHSVASALKQYFHELPDALLTQEYHDEFIHAAQIDNDVQRRDAIHATINKLPDSNYTTLRYLVFHLYRVQEREAMNRMSIVNLGIVWGPAVSAVDYNNVGEMALLGRIVETVLFNAYVIFDAD